MRFNHEKNRLTSIVYPTDTPLAYTYGDAAAPGQCSGLSNTKGRVCKVQDGGGTELRSYGALGEIVRTERVMASAPWESGTRTVRWRPIAYPPDVLGLRLRVPSVFPPIDFLVVGVLTDADAARILCRGLRQGKSYGTENIKSGYESAALAVT